MEIPNLERELESVGINYSVEYIEEHAELVESHHIKHSPNIFIDGRFVFRYQPSTAELQAYFHGSADNDKASSILLKYSNKSLCGMAY